MRIAIDIRPLLEPVHSGVQEYTINLLTALFDLAPQHQFVLFSSGRTRALRSVNFERLIAKKSQVTRVHLNLPNRYLNRSQQFLRWPRLNKALGAPDVFFAPNFGYWALDPRTPVIIAVHDLSFLRYPEFFSWRGRIWAKLVGPRKLAQSAARVLAMSHSTAADLKELLGVSSHKVAVVPSGILPQFKPIPKRDLRLKSVAQKYNLPATGYILFMGTLEPRKNLVGLILAFNALCEQMGPKTPPLVLAGPRGWLYEEILQAAAISPFSKSIHLIGPVAEADRPYVYAKARLFVYPSFFEGFGFPPLEAMACGVPVITANTSSIPEAVGIAALTIDPQRPDEIALAMAAVLSDQALRHRLIKLGFSQAAQFTWQKAALKTLAILKESRLTLRVL